MPPTAGRRTLKFSMTPTSHPTPRALSPAVADLVLVRCTAHMSPDSFSWITTVTGPVSSLLISAIFLYGAIYSRFRLAFGLIAFAGILFFASYAFWLVFKAQQSFGIVLLSKDTFRMLFPLQALSLYGGIVVAIVGDILLVLQVSRAEPRPNI